MLPIMANSKDDQGYKNQQKDLVTKNALVKYQNSRALYSKVISKIKDPPKNNPTVTWIAGGAQ